MNVRYVLFIVIALVSITTYSQEMWKGLTVAPEYRCSEFKRKQQYPYPQSVEDTIVELMGGIDEKA
jgi:hypothetical protein